MKTITSALGILVLGFGMHAAQAAGDAAQGESMYSAKGCVGCHGPAGNSFAPDMFPALTGRDAEYIITQLKAFRSGERQNPTMSPMASTLTDEEIEHIATYLSAQKAQ